MKIRVLLFSAISFLFVGCSSSSNDAETECENFMTIGEHVAGLCHGPLPSENVFTSCKGQISQCTADDLAKLTSYASCRGQLNNCKYDEAAKQCDATIGGGRGHLDQYFSAPCVKAIEAVTNAYRVQLGKPPLTLE